MTDVGRSRGRALLRQVLLTAFAVTVMYALAQRAAMLRFPFGGGEWHAIFAYSDGYRPAALLAFRVYLGTVCAAAALLIGLRYPLHWAVVGLAAAAVGVVYWWDIFTYRHQRESFRITLGLMMLAIPPLCFAVCGAVQYVRTALAERRVGRAAATGSHARP